MKSPDLSGDILCSKVAECFRYQIDIIYDNDNISAYRFGGDNQKISSYKDSLFQYIFQSFRDSFISYQKKDLYLRSKIQLISNNSREDFRYFEEYYGKSWKELEIKRRPENPNGDYRARSLIGTMAIH